MKFLEKNNFFILIIIGALLHILSAIYNVGFYNMDEQFQVLGPVEYLLGINNQLFTEIWEFTDAGRIRPWFQSYLYYFIIEILRFLEINDPFSWAFILRLLNSIFGFFVIILFYNLIKDDYKIN